MQFKTIKSIALCALIITTLHIPQSNAQTLSNQNITLSPMDSIAYAWGVVITNQGLAQYLERRGVFSSQKTDSENALTINEFFRGVEQTISLDATSSYTVGLAVGAQLAQMMEQVNYELREPLNPAIVLTSIMAILRNQPTAMTESEASTLFDNAMNAAQEEANARHEQEQREQFAETIAAGNTFLTENARRSGVTTLPSGLQLEFLRMGDGEKPTRSDRVRVHYHGTLLDGTVFDSSMHRGQDITFGVAQVIHGWQEALQLMPVGSKWRLFIPYHLAYGAQDRGIIRPFSVLIFDVELLAIE